MYMIRSGSEPGSAIDPLIYYVVVGVSWSAKRERSAESVEC